MITIHAFATPNSVRVPIALEELGLEYRLVAVNVRKGEQKQPGFLALNPNGKVPLLIDDDVPGGPLTLSESGAILIYLAEKTGRLLPTAPVARARVFEQLLFHVTGIGPAFGQLGFFKKQAAEQLPLAIARFETEAARTLAVLDRTLRTRPFVAGDDFTIADITHFGWLWRREFADIDLATFSNVLRWYEQIAARPAVVRGIARVTALLPAS
jgi:glutathione S-transferase